ncbi:MAG: hypothetical protein DHS20C12_26490 [Pseudohongiella sp.]|nr:MAG: hypothetical protein DHS20C12_26490 [Pseudohongiella sp.]
MTLTSNPNLHPNQCALAIELGLAVDGIDSAQEMVVALESKLGGDAELESARWFSVSVLRHMRKAKWTDPDASGLDRDAQLALARGCLSVEGFASSLRTVTKDARSKYRIIGFASSKNTDRVVLATGTKAFKIAAQVVSEAGLVEEQTKRSTAKTPTAKQSKPVAESVEAEKTVVSRRAKRRGYGDDELKKVASAVEGLSETASPVSMTDEEFASLDAALSKRDTEIVQQNWGDQESEDRLSRVLGLIAGAGFFVFVAMLFM